MRISTVASVTIQAPIEQVFDWSIDCQNLPQLFKGHQAIPAIVKATTVDGLPLHRGSIRLVESSDGSIIKECIVALERPYIQGYRLVSGLKPPFAWLVRSATGNWAYTATQRGTEITWQFQFETHHPVATLIFRALVQKSFQIAQQNCLMNLKHRVEQLKLLRAKFR